MNYDTTNEMFQLAVELVNQSSRNIFLTGKAGTGKTTFLKYIRGNCPKQIAVVAPTGVAAINAGGVTIHSFFQLPLSPFIPEAKGFSGNNDEVINRHSLLSRLRMSNEKKKVLQELELLVIDEISMVRCDTMDAIDTVLRHIRHKHYERFGGVQVLFIGDMFQLPPVIKDQEWKMLSEYYNSPYFFASKVIKEESPVYIEFNKIYRQSEEQFICLLNQVRNNELDEEGIKMLDARFNPAFRRTKHDGYIILTTHNDRARDINAIELRNLESKPFSFKAEITGEFYDNAYPADEILQLKVGAQVMFIKNDTDKSKRYFNGKIGIVSKLEDDKIFVQCKDEPSEIEVKRESWKNIRYALNKTTRQLDEEELGSFIQYPLRLAWAITIHKSQGLTFEKAIIDAGEAFAPGQVYVALSRCTNLNGMVLQSRVRSSGLFSDNRIVQFSQNSASPGQLQQELANSRKNYQLAILMSTFDFTTAINHTKEILKYLLEHTSAFNPEAFSWIEELHGKIDKLQVTAAKFHLKLQALFEQPQIPEENTALQERIKAAANYFTGESQSLLQLIPQSPAITDSRLYAKEYNETLKEVFAQLSLKKFLMDGCNGRFDMEAFHRRKKKFVLPPLTINAYAGNSQQRAESPHPVLHQQLRKLRDSICSKRDTPIYMVAGSRTIDEMAEYLPQGPEELIQISGFGKARVESYGQQFLEIIQQYCKENNLSSRIAGKTPKRQRKEKTGPKEPKVDTKAETYKLYREGIFVDNIAKTRNLTVQTIEGHLAYYVQRGEIKIEELISREKLLLIEPAIKNFDGGSIISIKEKLGNTVGFGEIRLVIAWTAFKNSIQA
jgi:PIF1-like helicase/Helix-turn-helix domain/HRDC domain/Helicase